MLYELPNNLGDSARVSGPIVPRFQNTVTTHKRGDIAPEVRPLSPLAAPTPQDVFDMQHWACWWKNNLLSIGLYGSISAHTGKREEKRKTCQAKQINTLIIIARICHEKFFPARLPIHQPYRRFLLLSSPLATPQDMRVYRGM